MCDRVILSSSLEDFPVLICVLDLVKAFDLCIPYSYVGVIYIFHLNCEVSGSLKMRMPLVGGL
jgi:hypothetical protein